MGPTLFLARILGPCMLAVAVGIMLNREFYLKIIEDYAKSPTLIFFSGLTALVIGIIVVHYHNSWVLAWPIVITLYGWGAVVKGVWLLLFPKSVGIVMGVYQKNPLLMGGNILIVLVLGAGLTYVGYFA